MTTHGWQNRLRQVPQASVDGHAMPRTRSFVDLNENGQVINLDPYQKSYENCTAFTPYLQDCNYMNVIPTRVPSPPRDRNGFRPDSIFYDASDSPSSLSSVDSLTASSPLAPSKSKNTIFDQSWAVERPFIESTLKSKNDIFNQVDKEPARPPPPLKGHPEPQQAGGDDNKITEPEYKKAASYLPRPRKLPGVTDAVLVGTPTPLSIKPSPSSISAPFVHLPLHSSSTLKVDPAKNAPLPSPHEINLILLPTQKNLLGIGRHSEVYKAKFSILSSPTPKMCAAKRLNPNLESQTLGLNEAFILRRLACLGGQHRNIIALLGIKDEADTCASNVLYNITNSIISSPDMTPSKFFHSEEGYGYPPSPTSIASLSASSSASASTASATSSAHLVLLLEYCSNGSLWDWVQLEKQKIGYKIWMKWARQLASAVARVHTAGFVHHDIKPHNILLTEALDVKLSDFGTALFVGSEKSLQDGLGRGTPPYSPPELVASPPYPYSFPVDIYSLGVTLYIIGFTAKEPFRSMRNPIELMVWIKKGGFWEWEEQLRVTSDNHHENNDNSSQLHFLNGDVVPEGIVDLLKEMLSKEPKNRPDANQVLRRLRALDEGCPEDMLDDNDPDDDNGFLGLAGGAGFDDNQQSLYGEEKDEMDIGDIGE